MEEDSAQGSHQPRPRRTFKDRMARDPSSPAWVVLILYLLWLGIQLPYSHDARDYIHIGKHFVEQGHGSSSISVDSYVARFATPSGYDGQFYYYIALDPLHALPYVDKPTVRFGRIGYPMLAHVLSLGQAHLVPYAMLAINFLALGGLTLAAAAWLRRRKVSIWFSLIPGLFPGFLLALRYDLTDPLAYALAAFGIYLFDYGGKNRLTWAAIVFALATLTRETTTVFPLLYGAGLMLRGDAELTAGDPQARCHDRGAPAYARLRAAMPVSGHSGRPVRRLQAVPEGGPGIRGRVRADYRSGAIRRHHRALPLAGSAAGGASHGLLPGPDLRRSGTVGPGPAMAAPARLGAAGERAALRRAAIAGKRKRPDGGRPGHGGCGAGIGVLHTRLRSSAQAESVVAVVERGTLAFAHAPLADRADSGFVPARAQRLNL